MAQRIAALLKWVAEEYMPPGSGGQVAVPQVARGVPDPQKYVFPKALARLHFNPQDTWAQAMVGQFWDKGGDPAPHAASFYHFAAYGLVRLLFAFPEAVAPHRDAILQAAMQEEQLFSADGTENHIAMWRTSGYLFAQEAGDARRLSAMTDWINGYAKRLRENGQGEWDSSTYMTFDVASWLNVRDYAKDAGIRATAQQVVDTFAEQMARKYVQGAFAGAEKRGFSKGSADTIAGYNGWLWFGDVPVPVNNDFFSQSAIYSVVPALSPYRPPAATVELALKRTVTAPKTILIVRPNYLMTRPGEAEEILYLTSRYGVGSSTKSPIGGWGGGDTQETLWKFVAKGTAQTGGARVIGGAGAGYAARSKYSGMGRSPWDQVWQQGSVVVQMTCVHRNADDLTAEAKALFDQWKQQGNTPKVSWADPVPQSWAYTTVPAAAAIETVDGVLLVRMGDVFAGIRPLHGAFTEVPADETKAGQDRRVFRTESGRGELTGWLYEFGDESTGSWESFATLFPAPERLKVDSLQVTYRPVRGDVVRVSFNPVGTYTEPEYDWGPQPTWPSGDGHGRVPRPVSS